ncbi:MAG: hypothetical protein K6E50_14880 [Lachnospiraceae bacterium]|nr:hypothetical protein [Lachnospiraceae bacterium]
MKKSSILSVAVVLLLSLSLIGCSSENDRPYRGRGPLLSDETPQFSDETMFTLRISEPWFYESLHYTLKSDGTLIVLYYNDELGREQLSEERMEEIRKVFSPEKVYNMDIGKEDEMSDGVSRYIILYDKDGIEMDIGGYELRGGDNFNRYFQKLYDLMEDDYTEQFAEKLRECAAECVTYREKYMSVSQN